MRQSAKRRSAPDVLTCNEVRQLLAALEPRERIMVLLDVATGLRQSELQDRDVGIGVFPDIEEVLIEATLALGVSPAIAQARAICRCASACVAKFNAMPG